MAVTLAEQEARRDVLSGSTGGGAILVGTDYGTTSDVTTVHHVDVSDAVDSVWLQAHNVSEVAVVLSLICNPSDDTDVTEIDNVTIDVEIPAQDSLWVLQGDAFRKRGSNTKTIAAYVATANVNEIRLTGYVVRAKGALLY